MFGNDAKNSLETTTFLIDDRQSIRTKNHYSTMPSIKESNESLLGSSSYSTEAISSKINRKNIWNLIGFLLNMGFVYAVGTASIFPGASTNSDLSKKYQTIITPSGRAFSIWALIYVSQTIFTIAQLLPKFRGHIMVQKGVSYWYLATCLAQVGWSFAFAYEAIPLSLAFMLVILFSLYGLLYSQYYTKSDGSLQEFWLLRFPFYIHAGWITAATALNVNVVAVWRSALAPTQLAMGIVSLAVLHAVSVWVLFNLKKSPNYTIACVLSWANGWIYSELQSPNDLVVGTFSEDIISGVANAAISVSFIILFQVIIRVFMSIIEARSSGRRENVEESNMNDDSML
mmetsp:Transcript_2436/g.3249  ORF Transcript_2436/g.3249 Transcript_2436/m.3249 type:complete len:343 (-) Transcript_2436:184-1212(-)